MLSTMMSASNLGPKILFQIHLKLEQLNFIQIQTPKWKKINPYFNAIGKKIFFISNIIFFK